MAGDERTREGDGSGSSGPGASSVDSEAVTRLSDEVESESESHASEDATVVDAGSASPSEAPPASAPDQEVDENAPTRVSDRPVERTPAGGEAHSSTGIEPGTVLFGEYEIEAVLGAGGMGEVYRARHRRLDELRAIKMMLAELSGKKGANEFFLREAKALLAVRHPAVVHCHDLLSDEQGRIFLIMEMIEGISLSDRIEQGPLPPDEVLVLGARVAAGLRAAHQCGVVHRDISPDNIVLPDGDVSRAKVIDFGIAKLLEEGQGTIIDGFKGKLSYASPEQLGFFGGRIDGRSDFYSLGLVLCAAALGRPMGMGRTVMEAVDARRELQHVPQEIPAGLRSTIEPLLALDPADRPKYVERLFTGPGVAPLPSVDEPDVVARAPTEPASRRWVPWAAAGAVAAGLAGYLLVPDSPPSPSPGAQTQTRAAPAPAPVKKPEPAAPEPARQKSAAVVEKPTAPPKPVKRQVTALDQVRIMGLLRGAETALAENRLQSPKGNNAYEKYREVLALDPDNRAARSGLVAVAGRYLTLTEQALVKGDLQQARTYLGRAASIAPHHPRLAEVRDAVASAPTG